MKTSVILTTRTRKYTLANGRTTTRTYWVLRWMDSQAKWRAETIGLTRAGGRRGGDADRVLSKAEAKDMRVEKERRLNDGVDLLDKPERCTISQFVPWHENLIAGDVEAATQVGYRTAAEHMIAAVGDVLVENINSAHVSRVKDHLRRAGKAPDTIGKTLRNLRAMFNRAVSHKMLAVNPFVAIATPRSRRKELRIFTEDEQRAMLQVIGNDIWWEALIELAFASGLRKDELLNLLWRDVDFEQKVVHVRERRGDTFMVDGAAYPILPWTVKDHEAREIPVPDHVLALLRRLQLKSGGSRYLFVSLERLTMVQALMSKPGRKRVKVDLVNNVLRRFKTIQKRARQLLARQRNVKLETVDWRIGSIHDMRRTYITRMAHHVPAHVLMGLAGHESLTTTQQYYLAISKGDMDAARKAAERKMA